MPAEMNGGPQLAPSMRPLKRANPFCLLAGSSVLRRRALITARGGAKNVVFRLTCEVILEPRLSRLRRREKQTSVLITGYCRNRPRRESPCNDAQCFGAP